MDDWWNEGLEGKNKGSKYTNMNELRKERDDEWKEGMNLKKGTKLKRKWDRKKTKGNE